MIRQGLLVPHRGEEGIALVTTLVILLIMTVMGVGAVAVTALENRIAGFQRTGESATSAAESCVGTSVNIIKQTLVAGAVPATFYATANDPVPSAAETAATSLTKEIIGQAPNDSDTVTNTGATGPDYRQQINGYDVKGDIDFLYQMTKPGSQQDSESQGGVDYMYRIDCRATLTAVGAESRVVSIYACTFNGGCQ